MMNNTNDDLHDLEARKEAALAQFARVAERLEAMMKTFEEDAEVCISTKDKREYAVGNTVMTLAWLDVQPRDTNKLIDAIACLVCCVDNTDLQLDMLNYTAQTMGVQRKEVMKAWRKRADFYQEAE